MSVGISVACSTKDLNGGVLVVALTAFSLETLEKIESKTFYFEGKDEVYSFKTQQDFERWDYYKNDVEEETEKMMEFLSTHTGGRGTVLSHNIQFEMSCLAELLQESVSCFFTNEPISLISTARFINHCYDDTIYDSFKFDNLCETHGISKGNKSQKQLSVYRSMVREIRSDVEKNESDPVIDQEPCYYCGATANDPKHNNCFLCGRVSLPIAFAEFIGSFVKERPVIAQAMNRCSLMRSTVKNELIMEFTSEDDFEVVKSNRKLILRFLHEYFGSNEITILPRMEA